MIDLLRESMAVQNFRINLTYARNVPANRISNLLSGHGLRCQESRHLLGIIRKKGTKKGGKKVPDLFLPI